MNQQEIPAFAMASPEASVQDILARTGEAVRPPLDRESYAYLGCEDISYARYTSQAFFDEEMDKVWLKTWQWACREEHIPEVGDYIVYDIGRKSVIVVRESEDVIKGYYNSCLHRGTKLCPSDSAGALKHFTCPYHGWQWNLDGSIHNIPSDWDFQHIKNDAFTLPEVMVDNWGGFVFINFDLEALPLLEYLDPIPEHFKNWNIDQRYTTIHIQKELPCNWKAAAEAFMENYHTKTTHPQLIPTTSGPSTQYDILGRHASRFYALTGVPDPVIGRELSEQEKLDSMLMGDGSMRSSIQVEEGGTARSTLANMLRKQFDEVLDVDVAGLTDGEIIDTMEYTIFPNMFLFPGLSLPMTYRFRPIGNDPNRSLFDLLFLRPIPRSGERPDPPEPVRIGISDSYAIVEGMDPSMAHVYDQDTSNLGYQQEGFHTSQKPGQTLANYQEVRIRHFQQTLDSYLKP